MTSAYLTSGTRPQQTAATRIRLAPSANHRDDLERHMARFSRHCRQIADLTLSQNRWATSAETQETLEVPAWLAARLLDHTKRVWTPGEAIGNRFNPSKAVPFDGVTAKATSFDRVALRLTCGTRNVAVRVEPGTSSLTLPEGRLALTKDNGEFVLNERTG